MNMFIVKKDMCTKCRKHIALTYSTKKESHVLMVVTRKADLNFLLKYVKSIDKDAFLSVSSVTGVYGKGFDTIKNSAIKEGSKEKSGK